MPLLDRYFPNKLSLLQRINRKLVTGIYKKPVWYEAVRMNPPWNKLPKAPHPGNIVYEEDNLYDEVYKRLPWLHQACAVESTYGDLAYTLAQKIALKYSQEVNKIEVPHASIPDRKIPLPPFLLNHFDPYKPPVEVPELYTSLNKIQLKRYKKLLKKNSPPKDAIVAKEYNPVQLDLGWKALEEDVELLKEVESFHQLFQASQFSTQKTPANLEAFLEREFLHKNNKRRLNVVPFGAEPLPIEVTFPPAVDTHSLNDLLVIRNEGKGNEEQIEKKPYVDEGIGVSLAELDLDSMIPKESGLVDASEEEKAAFRRVNEEIKQVFEELNSEREASAKLQETIELDNKLSFEWMLSRVQIDEKATLRDFVAFCLRIQILALRLKELTDWSPYTDCIDSTLWRQANYVLKIDRVELLKGADMKQIPKSAYLRTSDFYVAKASETSPSEDASETSPRSEAVGLIRGRPLVRDVDEVKPFSRKGQQKHAILMAFIDLALKRHEIIVKEASKMQFNDENFSDEHMSFSEDSEAEDEENVSDSDINQMDNSGDSSPYSLQQMLGEDKQADK